LKKQLFSFVEELSSPAPSASNADRQDVSPQYCYSYFGLYGDPLFDTDNDPYPDGYLARLAQAGVDGVWLQAVLSKLHPFPWDPELSEGYEKRLANLRRLVARAKRHGVRVFLYLNEPRAMPLRFFEDHPELKGTVEGDYAALCTSVPDVQAYLRNAIAAICRAVPDLGGFFTITMSENLTNCWSHYAAQTCPRCAARPGPEVIAEVNRLFAEGISSAGGKQELIVWDWGWPNDWAESTISHLPAGVGFMSVSEWDLPIVRGGVASTVGEYSISAVGPGPRATRHWSLAREHGLRTFAKIQAGATWEMSAVPYVPALRLVAEHARNLREAGIDGVMLGWTLGGYPSPNLEVAHDVLNGAPVQQAMLSAAETRYGAQIAPDVGEAWNKASDAFLEFPYHVSVVYNAPHHVAPANRLWTSPTGYRATMVGIPYDDLDGWRGIYPADVFVRQMRRTSEGFEEAANSLEKCLPRAGTHSKDLMLEIGLLRTCALHYGSTADQSEFIAARNQLAASPIEEQTGLRSRMLELTRHEITRAKRMYEIQTNDPRVGFEATNHYYYVPLDLVEKVLNCMQVMESLSTSRL
jgi:hypothetical protein